MKSYVLMKQEQVFYKYLAESKILFWTSIHGGVQVDVAQV